MAQIWQVFSGRGDRDTASCPRFPKAGFLSPVPALVYWGCILSSCFALIEDLRRLTKLHWHHWKQWAFFFTVPLSLAGCCHWTDSAGTRHSLIIGVGVVSVNESLPQAAQVTRANVLGVMADSGGVTAGFSSRFSTAVPANAEDVRIEASQRPFAPIKIAIQKAQLNQTNPPNQGDK